MRVKGIFSKRKKNHLNDLQQTTVTPQTIDVKLFLKLISTSRPRLPDND